MVSGYARDQGRWLLVNLQDPQAFASHRLNRDVWTDEGVRSILDSSFVFWQRSAGTPDGDQFSTMYKIPPEAMPTLAVISPLLSPRPKRRECFCGKSMCT